MKTRNFKRFSFILTLILILTVVAGCGPKETSDPVGQGETPVVESSAYPKTIEDGFGNKVVLEKAPEKIISTAPSKTEMLFALGLDDKIVGVSTADDYPAEALEKDQVASYEGLNLEKVLELDTDLVINFDNMSEKNPDDYKRLEESGIPVLSFAPETIDEVMETIIIIGQATGTEEKAEEITADMKERKEEIVSKLKDVEKKTVFYEVWDDPLQTAGTGSFIDEIISLAGGENIAADAEGAYPKYDLESLALKDPSIYIASDGDPNITVEAIKARPGYGDLSAVKNNNIFLVDANLISRAGPRVIEGLEMMAKTIYPDKF